MTTVYLGEYIYPGAVETLKKYANVVDSFDDPEKIEGIILRNVKVDAALMDLCPNLKVIGKHGVGVNTIDLDEAKKRGIAVFNTPLANANSVAELIGTGNIARIVGRICANGFGMKVVGYDPFVSKEQMNEMGYEKYDTVPELIRNADVINVSVPLTAETADLIAGDVFDCFRPGAILINAARGGIVNESDLYTALKERKLRAAACDAFVQEPPSGEKCKLYELDNFIGTPHIGACAEESLVRMGTQVVDGMMEYLVGDPSKVRRLV